MSGDSFDPFRQALDALLAALHGPGEFDARVQELRRELGRTDFGELPRLVADAAALIAHVRQQEERARSELEALLRELSAQSRNLERLLQGAEQQLHSAHQGAQREEQTIERQVESLEGHARFASGVESLREAIHRRLAVVRSLLDDARSKEAVQQAALQGQLNLVSHGVHDLERRVAVVSERLRRAFQSVDRDALTDLPNAHSLTAELEYSLAWWRDSATGCALQIWCIDGLDAVARDYGQETVERAIAQLARLFEANLRQGDLIVHLGMGEFAIIVRGSLAAASASGERLRAAVAAASFHYHRKPVRITVSGAFAVPGPSESAARLLARVRAAMEQVVTAGGDRFVEAPGD